MNGTILLKKLTEKSMIPAGKNAGCYVGEILQRSKISLIYSYFHYSNITFTDEILDKLRIEPEDRIAKPGKDPSKFEHYSNRNLYMSAITLATTATEDGDHTKVKMAANAIVRARKRGINKSRYKALIERERRSFSRGALQRKNQGH